MGKLAMASALLSATWLLAMVLIGGATYPGYDHASQYISELGATGAVRGFEVSWFGFLPIGVLMIGFAVLAWLSAPRSALSTLGFIGIVLFAAGYVGSAFFRCDFECRPEEPSFSQQMHLLIGFVGYMFAPLTLTLLTIAVRKWPKAGWLFVLGLLATIGSFLGLVTMAPDSPLVGVSQRVLETSVVGWVAACGLYLGLRPREQV